jgi:hypothetical protein
VAWEAKAAHEIRSRFSLWQNFISDLRHDPDQAAEFYAREVSWRVLLELLSAELPAPPPETEALETLDAALKSYWRPGEFVWEPELKTAFPEAPFWYLYGSIRK